MEALNQRLDELSKMTEEEAFSWYKHEIAPVLPEKVETKEDLMNYITAYWIESDSSSFPNIMEENIQIEGLLQEKLNLEKKLKLVEKELDPFLKDLKAFCLEKQLRKFTWMGFDMSYARPRKYLKLLVENKQIQDAHPEWVEERTGYERLSIKKSEQP